MPNWTTNSIKVIGTNTEVEKVMNYIKGENGEVDFNSIIPMPKELDIESSSVGETGFRYLLNKDKPNNSDKDKEIIQEVNNMPETRKRECLELGGKYLQNYQKYGAMNWYDWRTENWGTKWNAVQPFREGNTLYFLTAWTAPFPILQKISQLFPNVRLRFYCSYEGGEDSDKGTFKNGELL